MKITNHNINGNDRNKRNNIIPIKKSYINKIDNNKIDNITDNWINKKINLNFFQNKNLIQELRAKYLPDNEKENKNENNSEFMLNTTYKNELNIEHIEKNELSSNNLNSKPSLVSIQNQDNINDKKIENYLNYDKSEESEKKYINKNNEKDIKNINIKGNKLKQTKKSKQNNIIIENRFYTEIINSNILLDKNLIVNSIHGETYSSKIAKEKENQNNYNNNHKRNYMKYDLGKKESNFTKNDDNQYISLSLKNMKLDSNNGNIEESSTNKEFNKINKKENLDNILHNHKYQRNNNSQYINKQEIKLILQNKKLEKEIKNYEKLISPLINYINDINRILSQKEINPDDIPEIIKSENPSKTSFYINNLIRNLNKSKNDIALKLIENKGRKKHRIKGRNSNKIIDLKKYNIRTRKIYRSAEDVKNINYINNRMKLHYNEKGNYFYDDTSNKYIFDYYKSRNINCSACLIGNNISQRGYSPGICFHLDEGNENDSDSENNNEKKDS